MLLTRFTAFILLSFVLLACQQPPKKPVKPVLVEEIKPPLVINQQQHLNQAISNLENGRTESARKLIDELLTVNPKHATAKLLKNQLTQTASELFNTDDFTEYQLQSGDTLGKLAQDWLGNSIYFVILAQMNHIAIPALLKPGSIIKIPVTGKSQIIRKRQENSEINLQLMQNYLKDQKYLEGLKKSITLFVTDPDIDKLLQIQKQLIQALYDQSVKVSQQQKLVEQFEQFLSRSSRIEQRKLLKDSIENLQQKILITQSDLLLTNQEYQAAAEKLIQAKQFNNTFIYQSANKTEAEIVKTLHEQAIVYYRNHELEQALLNWQLITALQPDNQIAQTYSQRTKTLLKKLKQL